MPERRTTDPAAPSPRGSTIYGEKPPVEFKVGEEERKPSTLPPFIKRLGRGGRAGRREKFSDSLKENLAFLSWDISPDEFFGAAGNLGLFITAAVGVLFASLIVVGAPLLADALFKFGKFEVTQLEAAAFVVTAAVLLYGRRLGALFLESSIKSVVDGERALALGYIPEIVNYLIMSMRLSPNLEKACEFAATHGRGRIAEDFKTLVYYTQIGKYETIEEGLDELAYRWGPVNDDFKNALILIRTAVLESDKARREALLEKAAADVLEGSREKMDLYARALHQPTVYLYYFGILLPLMLAIVLPIGSSLVPNLPFGRPEFLIIIYCFLIPAGVFMFGRSILAGRPPTYVAPTIPQNYPGLPPKGTIKAGAVNVNATLLALLVLVGVVTAGFLADAAFKASVSPFQAQQVLIASPHLKYFCPQTTNANGVTVENAVACNPFVGRFMISGILIGFSLAVSIYLWGRYAARKQVQDGIRQMESEFKDAIYVLASRLGENRPIEDALQHAIEFLPKSKVTQETFRKIVENITQLGMTLDSAVFDKTYGALRYMPSQVIRGGFKIVIDAVGLGVNVASRSLIGLALQLRDQEKIDEMLKRLLSDVTSMLSTMATFIAPVVLAVVASMQQLIINSLIGASAGQEALGTTPATTGFGGGLGSMFKASNLQNSADPATFMLVMGLYVIEIVVLLTYFNAQVEDSNNPLHTYTSIAKTLPIAAIVYCAAIYVVSTTLAGTG